MLLLLFKYSDIVLWKNALGGIMFTFWKHLFSVHMCVPECMSMYQEGQKRGQIPEAGVTDGCNLHYVGAESL